MVTGVSSDGGVACAAAQSPLNSACPSGSAIRSIGAGGGVTCGPFTTTLVVAGNGSATDNGAALVKAVNAAVAAGPAAFIVKLEPGAYDVGSATLTLASTVDLEGSGTGTTNVLSASSLTLADGGLRNLTLQSNVVASGIAVAVNALGGGTISGIVLKASCNSALCAGVQGSPRIDSSEIDVDGGSDASVVAQGVDLLNGAALRNVTVKMSGSGSGGNTLVTEGGTITAESSTFCCRGDHVGRRHPAQRHLHRAPLELLGGCRRPSRSSRAAASRCSTATWPAPESQAR
jgi:hypothetical protein